MAKLQEKGKKGAASNYITRNQALKKLQITLADFRRLCILKGIYPREPRNKKKANKGSSAPVTFYYAKDIQHLMHEPLIDVIRKQKQIAKRVTKAMAYQDRKAVESLVKTRPKARLSHIIKERYPSFYDALGDLDDALTMIFLFAKLPSTNVISQEIIGNCERLKREFQIYCVQSQALKAVLLSVKGIYYKVQISGQEIIWLEPYNFNQVIDPDIDLRIMLTFIEFYCAFLNFVNFKLFATAGLVYPPPFSTDAEDPESEDIIRPTRITNSDTKPAPLQYKISRKQFMMRAKDSISKVQHLVGPDHVIEHETDGTEEEVVQEDDDFEPNLLFKDLTFYLSRETPKHSLEFVIKCFGGNVTWDPTFGGSPSLPEDSPKITHHIVDRPSVNERYSDRIYIQPQWIYDSVNARELKDTSLYAVGALLPPHLSPFDTSGVIEIENTQFGNAIKENEVKAESENDDQDGDDSNEDVNEQKDDVTLKNLAVGMLSNKKRKLYEKMMHSKQEKERKADVLKRRKRLAEKTAN